jgi:hypothetical protein
LLDDRPPAERTLEVLELGEAPQRDIDGTSKLGCV